MSMALNELGVPAVSLLDSSRHPDDRRHAKARMSASPGDRARARRRAGRVVPGSRDGDEMEVTTLGRGGSDTTAVALAAALKAQACEIFTDVPASTRRSAIRAERAIVAHIAYPECSSAIRRPGHASPRGRDRGGLRMELHVRSSFHAAPVPSSVQSNIMESGSGEGVAHERHVARLSVVAYPIAPESRPRSSRRCGSRHRRRRHRADREPRRSDRHVVHGVIRDGKQAERILQGVAQQIGARTVLAQMASPSSVIGSGIRGQPGVASTMSGRCRTTDQHRDDLDLGCASPASSTRSASRTRSRSAERSNCSAQNRAVRVPASSANWDRASMFSRWRSTSTSRSRRATLRNDDHLEGQVRRRCTEPKTDRPRAEDPFADGAAR